MQRTAAIATSSLRRLAAETISRTPVLFQAASLAGPSLPRPLAAPSLDLHGPLPSLLAPALQPFRAYARFNEIVPSDEEEDFDDNEGEADFDKNPDTWDNIDGEFNEYESGDEEMLDESD